MSQPRPSRRRGPGRAIAWLVLALGVVIALLAGAVVRQVLIDRGDDQVSGTVDAVAASVQTAVVRDLDLATSAHSYVSLTAQAATFPQLQAWFDSMGIGDRFPEAQGFGYIERVPADQLAGFVGDTYGLRVDPTGDVAAQVGIVPAGARPEYCLGRAGVEGDTAFSVPISAVDFCGGPLPEVSGPGTDLRPAFAQAATTGDLVLIPTATGDRQLVTVVLPVFTDPGVALGNPGREVRGWVTAGFDAGRVLDAALVASQPVRVEVLRDLPDGTTEPVASAEGRAPTADPVTRTVALGPLDGWKVAVTVDREPSATVANLQAGAVALVVVVITGLVFALVLVLGRSKEWAWDLVEEVTGELAHQALHDPLTDLPNRSLVLDRAEHLVERAHRSGTVPAALFVDLDGFKDVNDTFGHPIGDALLVQVGARFAGVLRQADTIGRLGGDEFVVLLEGDPESPRAERVADRLIHSLAEPFELDELPGHPLHIGASVGVAVGARASAAELLRDADVALYEAKSSGRGRFVVFRPEMLTPVEERLHRDHERTDRGGPGADSTGTPVGGR